MKANAQFWKKAIVILILITASYLLNACVANDSLNIITSYLPGARNWSTTAVALPTTVGSWISIPLVVLIGALILKFGAFSILKSTYLVVGAAVLVIGVTTSYPVYFAALTLIKVGTTAVTFANMAVCNSWFHSWRGRALGIVTIGAPLSTALGVPLLNLGTGTIGFPMTWAIFGALGIAFGVLLFFVGKSTPEEYGMLPDGIQRTEEELERVGASEDAPEIWTFRHLIHQKTYWFIVLSISIFGFVLGGLLPMYINICGSAGLDVAAAVSTLSVGTMLGIPLSFISGVIDDKFGTQKSAALVWGFCTVMCVLMALVCSGFTAGALYVATFCIGVVTGCFPNINTSLKSYVFGRRAFIEVNRTSSVVENLFIGAAMTVFAVVFDLTGSYLPIFVVLAVILFVATIGMLFVKSLAPETVGAKKTAELASRGDR